MLAGTVTGFPSFVAGLKRHFSMAVIAHSEELTSLDQHWPGLTVFVDHPEVPLDNNTAERCQRGPVLGRKNYDGSGSLWSGRLASRTHPL